MGKTTFDCIKINIASPERIRSWSERILPNGEIVGEITKPETINYRTLKPEMGGLFCEKVFGPIKDWECHCGKYKRYQYNGIVCERCGVEVTESRVRRERMGHIELATPVTHIWYLKSFPSTIATLLDISLKAVEFIIYLNACVVINPGDCPDLYYKKVLTEAESLEIDEHIYDGHEEYFNVEVSYGAVAIRSLLKHINLKKLSSQLRSELVTVKPSKRAKLIKRLRLVNNFLATKSDPSWMVLSCLPVLPPELRPMVLLDGGRFATSDLNDLYRRIINRNNRLNRLQELVVPKIIIKNEKRMLQESVDSLIDNGRRGRVVVGTNNRPLKSLSDIIEGKRGRFRQNLLGKRVDYSGRSVIVVGPNLSLHQCGLPKKMAFELFQPFIVHMLIYQGFVNNIKAAKNLLKREDPLIWAVLQKVIEKHPVLLNRAPTLHRLGIQAFEPLLIEGRAIKLHPLVCPAFNADFDGDQMAVHIPLSLESQLEARIKMLAVNNFLSPATGKAILVPTQDMVLGFYYLTLRTPNSKSFVQNCYFSDLEDALLAFNTGNIALHTDIWVRITDKDNFMVPQLSVPDSTAPLAVSGSTSFLIKTTVGRILLNVTIRDSLY